MDNFPELLWSHKCGTTVVLCILLLAACNIMIRLGHTKIVSFLLPLLPLCTKRTVQKPSVGRRKEKSLQLQEEKRRRKEVEQRSSFFLESDGQGREAKKKEEK